MSGRGACLDNAAALSLYTNLGFLGIIPEDISDKFYRLPNDVSTIYSMYTVSPVPLPPALWLFGSGLLVLFRASKRGNKSF